MITDSNQVCFVKMFGRRVQEVLFVLIGSRKLLLNLGITPFIGYYFL